MRQPLGVCAAIAPFNFPAMVPLWFLPFAVACGNTFMLKPSEQRPADAGAHLRAARPMRPAARASSTSCTAAREVGRGDLRPSGHPRRLVRRVDRRSRARSTSAARTRASACRRSAARRTSSSSCPTPISTARPASSPSPSSAARGSAAWPAACSCPSGARHAEARDRLAESARALRVGDGVGRETGMGPVISAAHRDRVLGYIEKGISEGAKLVLDGRQNAASGRRADSSSDRRSSTACGRR